MPKNHWGEPTRVTGLFSPRRGCSPTPERHERARVLAVAGGRGKSLGGEALLTLRGVPRARARHEESRGGGSRRAPRSTTRHPPIRLASSETQTLFFPSTSLDADRDPTLAARHDSQPFRSVEDGGDAETHRYAKTPRTAVKTVRSTRDDPNLSPLIATRENSAFRDRSELTSPPNPVRSTSAPSPTRTRMRYASDPCDITHEPRARSIRLCAIPPSRPRTIRSRPRYPPPTRAQESRYNLRSKTPTTMMKSMNKLGLYVPPAMRNPKDTETNDAAVHKTEGRKVGFAIPAPRTAVEVYKSSNRENHPPGFGPSDVDQAPSAKELPAPKPAPLAAICRNAAVASRKRSTADVGGKSEGCTAGGGARRGSRSRGGRGRSGSSTRTVTVVIPKASAGPR